MNRPDNPELLKIYPSNAEASRWLNSTCTHIWAVMIEIPTIQTAEIFIINNIGHSVHKPIIRRMIRSYWAYNLDIFSKFIFEYFTQSNLNTLRRLLKQSTGLDFHDSIDIQNSAFPSDILLANHMWHMICHEDDIPSCLCIQ